MRGVLWIWSVLLLAACSSVSCLTNREFFDLIEPYAEVTEVYGEDDLEDSADVITLPGEPDDEVDYEFLLKRLGVFDQGEIKGVGAKTTHLWWHPFHHHHHHGPEFHCSCHHDSCGCCTHHKFNFLFKHFTLKACLTVSFLPTDLGFEVTFSMNGHRLYHKECSIKHPPALCYSVPGLRGFARVCLELYDVNLATKHVCARVVGVLDLKFHKFKVHLKLGCFSIPVLDKDAFLMMVKDKDFLKIKPLGGLPSRDLTHVFRSLQQKRQSHDADSYDSDDIVYE